VRKQDEELSKLADDLVQKRVNHMLQLEASLSSSNYLSTELKSTQLLLKHESTRTSSLQERLQSLESSFRASLDAVLLDKERESKERKVLEKEVERLVIEVQRLSSQLFEVTSEKEQLQTQFSSERARR